MNFRIGIKRISRFVGEPIRLILNARFSNRISLPNPVGQPKPFKQATQFPAIMIARRNPHTRHARHQTEKAKVIGDTDIEVHRRNQTLALPRIIRRLMRYYLPIIGETFPKPGQSLLVLFCRPLTSRD